MVRNPFLKVASLPFNQVSNPTFYHFDHCFTQEKDLLAVIGRGNVHRCSGDPIEGGSYSLQAEGAMIEKFRANGKAELIAKVEETPEQEEDKKAEHIAVDLPVDFSKQSLDRVNTERFSFFLDKFVYIVHDMWLLSNSGFLTCVGMNLKIILVFYIDEF